MTDHEKDTENLKLQIDILRGERNQARRDYCYYVAADRSTLDKNNPWYMMYDDNAPLKVAEEMGWDDCFDKSKEQEALARLAELDEELGLQ